MIDSPGQMRAQITELTKRLGAVCLERDVIAGEIRTSLKMPLLAAETRIRELEQLNEALERLVEIYNKRGRRGAFPRGWWFACIGLRAASFRTRREAMAWVASQDRRTRRSRNARFTNAVILQAGATRIYHGRGSYSERMVMAQRIKKVKIWRRVWRVL